MGEGKITAASSFVHHRFFEGLWLATLLLVWGGIHAAVAKWLSGKVPSRRAAIMRLVLALICLNLWLSQAERSVLFWGLLWQGKQTQNLTRFYIKLILARENPAPVQAALMGSSQVRAQIDEELLNSVMSGRLHTTELHYPGSKAHDVFLLQPIVSRIDPQYIICYVSEGDFYGGGASEGVPNFLTFAQLPALVRLGGHKFIPRREIAYGLLGNALPIFRLREVLAQRFFGPQIVQLKQQRYDAAIEADFAERARRAAKLYALNDQTQFQRRAFEQFVVRCRARNQRVIILCGQLNPLFGDALEPRFRQETLAFLRSLAARYSNVLFIKNLPKQTPEDYEDLTHVLKPAQERFTRFLAERLLDLLNAERGERR